MTNNANTPNGVIENNNIPQGIIQSNINGLLEDSVLGIFGKLDHSGNDFSSAVNPDVYNEYKNTPGAFIQNIKAEMKSIRNIENKKSYNATDAEIDALIDQKIKNTILAHTAKFVALRQRVMKKATQLDTDLFQDAGKIHIFGQNIEKLTQEELEKLAWYPRKLFAKIREIFPDVQEEQEATLFKKIFHDIDTVNPNPQERAILDRLIVDWERGSSLKESDLELVLRIYKTAPVARKKKLLQSLNAEFSLAFALQNRWITEDKVDTLLSNTFPELGVLNTPEEKKHVRDTVLKKGDFYITIDDMESHLDALFDGNNRKTLAKILEKEWAHGPNIRDAAENQEQSGISKEITDQFNLKNPDGTGDYSYHQAFLDVIQNKLKNPDGKEKIPGIEKLKNDSVIAYTKDGKSRYIRIKKTGSGSKDILPLDVLNNTETGIQVANITGSKEATIGSEKIFELSYEQLNGILKGMDNGIVYSKDEFDAMTVTDPSHLTEGKILDTSEAESPTVNQQNLLLKLNELNPEGSQYGFEAGTYFTAGATEESKDGKNSKKIQSAIWKVEKIHDGMIDVQYEKGNIEKNLPIQQFYDVLAESGFKRINSLKDDSSFISAMKSDSDLGLFENTELDHGHLSFKEKDENGKEHKYTLHNFVGSGDEHIRMGAIKDGLVEFGEYNGEDIEKAKKYIEKKGEKKAPGFYTWRIMTYGAFLEYLKKNKLKASKEDKLVPHAHHEHEHGTHPHMHGSFWSKVFNAYSFHDLFKGGEMLMHSIEHALEKGAKANSARAALNMGKFLHLPASIQAQLTADIVDGNKELIEKYTKKLQNLNGPIGRAKAIHVTHNRDARPEEVVAAIYHMIQGYGQLYAEDPEMLNQKGHSGQGSDAFLYALINACGFKGDELEKMKEQAYKKGSEEMFPDKCTEEGAIYGFMKIIDGKADEYPIPAALIKASGGPGGFEKAWRTEGAENARQKGERQAGAVPNQDARLNKVIGYMKTGEYNSAVGGLKKMMGKTPDTKYRAGDFVFLVGGFTGMLSNDARQKLFAENQGSPFHACAFVRHDHLAETYIATVRLALADMGGDYLNRFNNIMAGAPYKKDMVIDGKKQSFVEHMSDFWQSTYGKGLHDRLQGHNSWLFETAKNNETVRKYIKQLHDIHNQQLSGGTPSLEGNSDNSVYSQYGYADSNIFHYDANTNTRSIANMLKKLKFHGGGIESMKKMDDEVVGRVWKPILNTLNKTLTEDGATEEQKKKQFLKTRSELIEYFSTEFSTTTKKWNPEEIERQLNSQPYFKDLQATGIDPHGLFPYAYPSKNFEEQDYQAWKNYRSSGVSRGDTSRPDVQAEFAAVRSKVNTNLQGGG